MTLIEHAAGQTPAGWRPERLERLEELARLAGAVRVAVVFPVDGPSLIGALEAQSRGLIEAVLVGPEAMIRQVAKSEDRDLGATQIIAAATPELRFHGALGNEVVDIVVDGCKVFLRTAASQAASAASGKETPACEPVLEPDFYPFFTACQRESLQVSKGLVTVTLGRMAMGAGGCCATGGTYPSRDGRVWKKS